MSLLTQDSEPSDKVRKNKKKNQHKNKQDSRNSTTLVTRVNMAKVGDKTRRKKEVSEIRYYNCNKNEYFATKCLKSQKLKNKYWSRQSLRR